jgi:mitochondrial fission protein ELM1
MILNSCLSNNAYSASMSAADFITTSSKGKNLRSEALSPNAFSTCLK